MLVPKMSILEEELTVVIIYRHPATYHCVSEFKLSERSFKDQGDSYQQIQCIVSVVWKKVKGMFGVLGTAH